ncbi:MAG: 3-(3-hydroxyphenyl)propionate hydroxylase, partial [Methylobacterium sp.]
ELVGVEQVGDQVVARVRAGGEDERIEARWLVGCDGGQSGVRKAAGVPFVGETFEQIRMWVGDLTLDGLDRDHWHLWRSPDGFLALCPLPGTDQFQFQAQIPPEEGREPSIEAFADLIGQQAGRTDIRLLAAGWLSSWRANVRMVERLRTGRVLLAGDAAHVHSPAGAQGMNTGMQDAYNLGWKLAAVRAGADERLVDSYGEERLPVARGVLALSSELTHTAFSPERRRDERTSQLDLDYRSSSLSVEAGVASATIRAGDRAPDAMGLQGADGTVCRLFDLLRGPQATVLVFGNDGPPLATELGELGEAVRLVRIVTAGDRADGAWIDVEGAAYRLYAPMRDALFVIRPDGYVGLTGSTADRTA